MRRHGLSGAAAAVSLLSLGPPARADLWEYLARPEPEARWERRSHERARGLEVLSAELVSQRWRGMRWTHGLRILRREGPVAPDLALLVIAGSDPDWPREERLARETGAVVAVLTDVPNQPRFLGRREDDLVAHTFQQYLATGDEEWPLLFPMTKAAVRAMDAVQELSREAWSRRVERFILTGASKRGWTAWLGAAADPRVVGVAPLVFDNLNFGPQMRHQLATWGRYSDELDDYTRRGLPALIDSERGSRLAGMVDPYAYRDRLGRVAKLVVNGTNDPYWTLDALNLYWAGLAGEKAVLYVPNARHELSYDPRVVAALAAFVARVGGGRSMPRLGGEYREAGRSLRLWITSDEEPAAVRARHARAASRDFRNARWEALVARREHGAYVAEVTLEAGGFVALFGEAEYHEGAGTFTLSTPVRIVGGDAFP